MIDLKLAIYESEVNGIISESVRDNMLYIIESKDNVNDKNVDNETSIKDKLAFYSESNVHRKIMSKNIILKSKSPEDRIKNFNHEINTMKSLISYCEKQMEKAPEKPSMKSILKQAHKAGLKGAAIGATTSLMGSSIGMSKSAKSATVAGSISNGSLSDFHLPEAKNGWNGLINSLNKNIQKLTELFQKYDQVLKKKGK